MPVQAHLRRFADPLLAVVLALAITVEMLVWQPDELSRGIALGLMATLPLALRRRAPIVAFALVMLSLRLVSENVRGFDNDSFAYVLAFFVALYSAGRYARGYQMWLGAAGVVAAMVSFYISDGGSDAGDVAFTVVFIGSPYVAGLTIRLRRERESVLRARNDELRAEQEELARRAVTEERSRIARELHDVVSHAIAVTVLQARGARRQLGKSEDDVRRALDAIEQTNTAALSDMRRLLAVLRDTEDDGVDARHPQPSLVMLDELAREVTAAGVPVELQVVGEPSPVPPGVDLSAYRIVQEALTNVLKHAGPAEATVVLDYRPDSLVVRVQDTGTGNGNTPRNGNGNGHGLIGIRERVGVVGGEVTVGPSPGGGFEVAAHLPYSLEAS